MARIAVHRCIWRPDTEHHCRRFDLPAGYAQPSRVLLARVIHERADLCVARAVGTFAGTDLPGQSLPGSRLCAAYQETGGRPALVTVAAVRRSSGSAAAGVLPEVWCALGCGIGTVPVVRVSGIVTCCGQNLPAEPVNSPASVR